MSRKLRKQTFGEIEMYAPRADVKATVIALAIAIILTPILFLILETSGAMDAVVQSVASNF
ncbi:MULTISPECIES: hypothetical protein [Alphaproteobacteria]|uniref:hypothetical protein n=1 Tax=Alphaproteobacteria TaxID=28211 RepID=UPI003262CE5E